MLSDNFSTLLSKPEGRKVHPYNSAQDDVAMFIHQGGWANEAVHRRVDRLRGILAQRNAFGIAFYLAGEVNIGISLPEIIEDARAVLDMEAGFCHILLVWFEEERGQQLPRDQWKSISDRLTLLSFSPRRMLYHNEELAQEDCKQLQDVLKKRFPNVFGTTSCPPEAEVPNLNGIHQAGSSADDDVRSAASSEDDCQWGVDSSFDNSPYEKEAVRRKLRSMRQAQMEVIPQKPSETFQCGSRRELPLPGRIFSPIEIEFFSPKGLRQSLGREADLIALTFVRGRFYFVSKDQKLWGRVNLGHQQGAFLIDHAYHIVNMASSNDMLFVLDTYGMLWQRDTQVRRTEGHWIMCGRAPVNARAIAVMQDHMYAMIGNKIVRRRIKGPHTEWFFHCSLPKNDSLVGVDIASDGARLICLTKSHEFYKHLGGSFGWMSMGQSPDAFAVTTNHGQIICAKEMVPMKR